MQESNCLFVYGTLMRPFAHPMHRVLEKYAHFVAQAKVRGQLYEIDGYPGLILTNMNAFVEGELYKIDDEKSLFTQLDRYEECSADFPEPHEYERIVVEIFLEDGGMTNAWLYRYNHPVDPAKLISSGRFLY
jgi:gamma-glutamylcyclotransferase (GGCT)/AIG2-like uncharacterized protein YtfP